MIAVISIPKILINLAAMTLALWFVYLFITKVVIPAFYIYRDEKKEDKLAKAKKGKEKKSESKQHRDNS